MQKEKLREKADFVVLEAFKELFEVVLCEVRAQDRAGEHILYFNILKKEIQELK